MAKYSIKLLYLLETKLHHQFVKNYSSTKKINHFSWNQTTLPNYKIKNIVITPIFFKLVCTRIGILLAV